MLKSYIKLMSNILFKYGPLDPDDEPADSGASGSGTGPSSSRPAEVKFIDFQSARFTSLATDLVYFIFTSVRVRVIVLANVLVQTPVLQSGQLRFIIVHTLHPTTHLSQIDIVKRSQNILSRARSVAKCWGS